MCAVGGKCRESKRRIDVLVDFAWYCMALCVFLYVFVYLIWRLPDRAAEYAGLVGQMSNEKRCLLLMIGLVFCRKTN